MQVLPSAMWGKKATAAVVAGAFLFTTVGEPLAQTNFWSDRQAARSRMANRSAVVAHNPLSSIDWPNETLNPLLDNFKIPANLGSIVETHVATTVGNTPRKTLIHIQDAHGIFDAQLNAAQILEGLRIARWAGREGPITVYQEGGTGPADTDGLSSFPFADIREEVGRAFLRQKEITGEEYRALASSSGTFRLVGVETTDLYDRNLACRHDTVSARSMADRHISVLQAALDDIKRTVYSPSLLTLDAAIKDYEAHKIGFDEYIQAMTKTLYVREKDYPQLAAFVALLKTEHELDSKALATERTILVQKLADRLSPEAVRDLTDRAATLRAGQTTHLEFYEALLSAVAAVQRPGETVPTYHLGRYVRYLRQTEKIRHGMLLTESDTLRDHALETLSGSDRVRQLVRLDRRLALEKLLWRQELTPDQYAALRKIDSMDWPATARFLSEQGAPEVPTDFAWTSAQDQVQAYYELAENRDQALSSNALNEMDRTGVTRAVLIAGGFHTPGLTRLWREQGINYVVVQPRFDLQESAPAPTELKISKDMLIARAQVRERLGMGRDGVGAPMGQNVSNQISFSMLGRAALDKVLGAVGEKMKTQKEAAIQKLKPWMAKNKIQILSAIQTGNTAESATALVFGQKNGVPFVMAYQEGGNRFVVLDPKKLSKDVAGNYSAALTRQLEGLVTNQTINWQGFVGALSAMKLNEAKSAFNETLAPFATRIVDFAAKSNEPLTPHAKEGDEIIQAAVEAAQKATTRAPSRIRDHFSGFLNKYFNRKTLTVATVPPIFFWRKNLMPALQNPFMGNSSLFVRLRIASMVLVPLLLFFPLSMVNPASAAQIVDNGAIVLVEKGDKVWTIAQSDLQRKNGSKVSDAIVAKRIAQYQAANPGVNLNTIRPGDRLVIPLANEAMSTTVPIEKVKSGSPVTTNNLEPGPEIISSEQVERAVVPPEGVPTLSTNKSNATPSHPKGELAPRLPSAGPRDQKPPRIAGVQTEKPSISWAAYLAGIFGGIGGLVSLKWRRRGSSDLSVLASEVSDEMKKDPRTFPTQLWARILKQYIIWSHGGLRKLREELRKVSSQNTPDKDSRIKAIQEQIKEKTANVIPRYNNYGSHGRFSAYIGLFQIKRLVLDAEKRDQDLIGFRKELKEVQRQLRLLGNKDTTVQSVEARKDFVTKRKKADDLESGILDRQIEIQRKIINKFLGDLDSHRAEVIGNNDELKGQREVMWRAARRTFEFYQDRLIPQGVVASVIAIVFLNSSKILRLAFAFVFLIEVFFFPSYILTSVTWVILIPTLYFISQTAIQPLMITLFMTLSLFFESLAPQGHRRVEFLKFVREFRRAKGRPYSFSIEVPKMSGNPIDGFLKNDTVGEFFNLGKAGISKLNSAHNFNSESPWSEVSLPESFEETQSKALSEFARTKMWKGFRLSVKVEIYEKVTDGKFQGFRMRISPENGELVNRLAETLTFATQGRFELSDSNPLQIVGGNTIEINAYRFVEEIGDRQIEPDEGEFAASLSMKGRDALRELLGSKSDYNLAIEESNVVLGMDDFTVDGRRARRVTYRFRIEAGYVNEISQNLNMTTRFMDTLHIEADVWAAYRRADMNALAQTLQDAGEALSVSFVMTSNTSDGNLIPYEMENIQALQREADQRFGPGRVRFLYLSQGIEWMDQGEMKNAEWREALKADDPLSKFLNPNGSQKPITLINQNGDRDYFRAVMVNGQTSFSHSHTTSGGQRSVETLSREEATTLIKSLASTTQIVVPWKTAGWGKKLGNVAGLEWFKMGFTRPPAYTDPKAHEHFTNPDAPIFPRSAVFSGDLLGYFHGSVNVLQSNGETVLYQENSEGKVSRTYSRSGKSEQLTLAQANKYLAEHMADPMTDRFTNEKGEDLQPNDLDLVLDDKNSVLEGSVEAVISVAEHPANKGVIGFNPVINVDAPMDTRGGHVGGRVSSVYLDSMDQARRIHNKAQALFMANIFSKMSPMYGKLAKRAEYGMAFLNEFIVVSRALSHDWQESIFSFTESVYGASTFRFELVDEKRSDDVEGRSVTYTYRMKQGSRTDFVRMEFGRPGTYEADVLEARISLLEDNGEFIPWRSFRIPADVGPQEAMRRISRYLSGTFEINERDLLTRTGGMERDFRWLRGDSQMYFTTTPYNHDALPPAHQFHRTGITFRLLGDAAFYFTVFYLISFSFAVEHAFMANPLMAAGLLGLVMIGVAGQGLFLYPAVYDVLRATLVQHSPPSIRKGVRWFIVVEKTIVNFIRFFPKVALSTLMSLDISPKRASFVVRSVLEELAGVPSDWKTSTSRAVREALGFNVKEVWREETQQMTLPFYGFVVLLVFGTIAASGNAYMAVLWPMGPIPLLASLVFGWYLGHLAAIPYRVTDQRARFKRKFTVYSLAITIATAIFLSPWNYLKTGFDVENLRPTKPADIITTKLASPYTRTTPGVLLGIMDIAGNPALEIEKTAVYGVVTPRVYPVTRDIGAGIQTEIVGSPDHFELTGKPDTRSRPPVVALTPYAKIEVPQVKSLALLKKQKLTDQQSEKLVYLLSQLDRMNSAEVKKQNVGIYAGSTFLLTKIPLLGTVFRALDWGTYLNVVATMDYPWMKEPMVAKYWAQTAFLMDFNSDGKEGSADAVRNLKDISKLLLWDKVKDVWDVDYTKFVETNRTLKDPETGKILLSEEDYSSLADRLSGSMDKYELISSAVINLHYGLGVPLEKIDGAMVWSFIRLSHELEAAWSVAVPNVDITPFEFLPKPVSKTMRLAGNITFVLPIQIPILSELRLEMIPMVGAFLQEPGGIKEFFTQMLLTNQGDLRSQAGDQYIAEFMKRVGSEYIKTYYDADKFPAHTALENLVRERMVRDMAKFNKVPSEKDVRLAYLQTEYNLGRIALFNRDGVETKDVKKIRSAAQNVAAHLTDSREIAKKTSPLLYERYMRFEPGVLEAEGIVLFLLESDPALLNEYKRIYREGLEESESVVRDMDQNKWRPSPAYVEYVMSLFPPETAREMTDAAREYNAVRDLAMLSLNLKENKVSGSDGMPYSPRMIMKELLQVHKRLASYHLPTKPGILASNLLHWLKTKTDHPEITEKFYWEENRLPILVFWAEWSANKSLMLELDKSAAWQEFSAKVNGGIEKEMGFKIKDKEVRQFNAIQSVAQLVEVTLQAFPHLKEKYNQDPSFVASLILTLAKRSNAYDDYFSTLSNLPSADVGFREYFVTAGYEVNGMNKPFDPASGFDREVRGFILKPLNDLWNSNVYETLPPEFIKVIESLMRENQKKIGVAGGSIKPTELKMQALRAFYEMSYSALYSNQFPTALPEYGPELLKQVIGAGKILTGHLAGIYQQTADLPGVRDYLEKEPGILENEAIQIFLLEKRSTRGEFKVGNYMYHNRLVYKKLQEILDNQGNLLKKEAFQKYRAVRVDLLKEYVRKRITPRGKDYLALRSISNVIVNAEFNDMRPDGPLSKQALSPEGWMSLFVDTWDHFANGQKYAKEGGQTFKHVPYREEGFVDMVTLLIQKWGYKDFWSNYYYIRLKQLEKLMSDSAFQSFMSDPKGDGQRLLKLINEDIYKKSGIYYSPGHPIFTFNGIFGLSEMVLDAQKKFPGYPIQYSLIIERYLAYHRLFHDEKKFQNLPFEEEGFMESLVTSGYVFAAEGGNFKDEIRIMNLKEVDLLMGANLLPSEKKEFDPNLKREVPKKVLSPDEQRDEDLRKALETIIRQESTIPEGIPRRIIDFLILQKIIGIGQTYKMLSGSPDSESGQRSLNIPADLPILKESMKALVYLHREIRGKTETGEDVYPKLRPIFEILGESEKWVGRMYALGILDESRFSEIFTRHIQVLEAQFDLLKDTYLPAEDFENGAKYSGELGGYLTVLREKIGTEANRQQTRLIPSRSRELSQVNRVDERKLENEDADDQVVSRVIFAIPEIDERQFILDLGYITLREMIQMTGRIDNSGDLSFEGLTSERLLSRFANAQKQLKTKHYKSELIRVQNTKNSKDIGRLNGMINNYSIKFAFIDYFAFSSHAQPEIVRFMEENGIKSIDEFIDRFFENLQRVRAIPELAKALDDLRASNAYSAQGVEFSYAMMLTLNNRVSPEFLDNFARHIPNILRDYTDFLTQGKETVLKFRVDSAVVLYEALTRELADSRLLGRPLGDIGDRIEVKQKRINSPWMARTIVKAVYGDLFGIYLNDEKPEDEKLLKQWEVKARTMTLSQIVQELLTASTINGEPNPYNDEIKQVKKAMAELTVKIENANAEKKKSLAESHQVALDFLAENLLSLKEKEDYLKTLAKNMEETYEAGIGDKNDGLRQFLLLVSLVGLGFGVFRLRRGENLSPIYSALAVGLAVYYGYNPSALYGDVTNPRIVEDFRAVSSKVPFLFEQPKDPRVLFEKDRFRVLQTGTESRPELLIFRDGYPLARVEPNTGRWNLIPPPILGPSGIPYPLSQGPTMLVSRFALGKQHNGESPDYVHGAKLSDIQFALAPNDGIVLQASVIDSSGYLSMNDYQMVFRYENGRTVANVDGTWVATRDFTASYMALMGRLNSISANKNVAKENRPYQSSVLEIQQHGVPTLEISLGENDNGASGRKTIYESPLKSLTFDGSGLTFHNSPAVSLSVGEVRLTRGGASYPVYMGTSYSWEQSALPFMENVSASPIAVTQEAPGNPTSVIEWASGDSLYVRYNVEAVSPSGPSKIIEPPQSAPTISSPKPSLSSYWLAVGLLGLGLGGWFVARYWKNIRAQFSFRQRAKARNLFSLIFTIGLAGLFFGVNSNSYAQTAGVIETKVNVERVVKKEERDVVLLEKNGWTVLGGGDVNPEAPRIQTPLGSFPQIKIKLKGDEVFNVKGNGYLRSSPPSLTPGTEWVTPGYWSDGRYIHGARIAEANVMVDEKGNLQLEGVLADEANRWGANDLKIRFYTQSNNEGVRTALMDISFTAIAKKKFALDPNRIENHEAFKVFQFSTKNTGRDSEGDVVMFKNPNRELIKRDLGISQGRLVFKDPVPLGSPGLISIEITRQYRTLYYPNAFLVTADTMKGTELIPQGFIQETKNPKDRNVNFWVALADPQQVYDPGDVIVRAGFTLGTTHAKMFSPEGNKILGLPSEFVPQPELKQPPPPQEQTGFFKRFIQWLRINLKIYFSDKIGDRISGLREIGFDGIMWFMGGLAGFMMGKNIYRWAYRKSLETSAKTYFDLLNMGEVVNKGRSPRVFLLLGNPFLQSVTDLAFKWKDGFQNVPIVLAGGIGAGTPGLLAAVKKQFATDDQGIMDFLIQQSPALYSMRDFKTDPMTEADLMRFTLMKSGVPSIMIHQETVPSSTLDENFRNTQEILQGLAGTGSVGVITGAPMRLRFGAVAANMKTQLDLSYEPVVMNVGPQNLASMSDDELADFVQVRAGNNGGEVAWWANALGRDMSEGEETLKHKLEFARDDALEKLKQFNSMRVQKSVWDTSLNKAKNILQTTVEFGKKSVAFVSTISERIFIKSWVKPALIAGLIAAALYAGSTWAASAVEGRLVVAGQTAMAGGTSLAVSRLSTVAMPAIFGLGVAAVAVKGRTSSTLVSPLGVLSDSINRILRWGALLDVPTPGVAIPKGHALFVDLRSGTQIDSMGNVKVDPAVGALFLAQVRSLAQQLTAADSQRRVRIELVVSAADYASLKETSPAKAFQALLSQAGISKSIADQIDFGILMESQVAQKLADLAPTMHLNVVAPAGDGLAFWQEVGKQANVSLAILLAQLMGEVDVTFTGEAAKEMARRANQQVNEDGTFTLKKALSPIEALARDQQKLLLLNIQA